ncbi:hypothetical protein HID58_058751 [Brassica napus]|uniref:Uncharacterized protein n=1 Tax=Brassica napus TaxID=3708 RepID=A0ABQ7ZRN3_BRANA|nr:hypothetical protein HID58_058751 [Brassica napus]
MPTEFRESEASLCFLSFSIMVDDELWYGFLIRYKECRSFSSRSVPHILFTHFTIFQPYVHMFDFLEIYKPTMNFLCPCPFFVAFTNDATARDANCNLFKTENITRIVYDELLSDKEGHKKWFSGWLKPNMRLQLKSDFMGCKRSKAVLVVDCTIALY